MKKGTLIIFSGLPGSGKSTLASMLAAKMSMTYLRVDTLEQGLKDVCKMPKIEGEGYRLSYRIAQENLSLGNKVIADSVNPWNLTRNEWNSVAADVGAKFINIEIICSHEKEHKSRVEGRAESAPGVRPPTWQEVKDRDYHPWEMDRVVLDTAGKSVDACLDELVAAIERG